MNPIEIVILLLQVASVGLSIYLLAQLNKLFREIRNPVVRQKNQLPNEFKDRLRTLPRPDGQGRENRDNREGREPRGDRPQGDRSREPRGDRPQGGDRDRNREPRGDRPQGDWDRNREPRGDRPQGNREPRPESAPAVAESSAPAAAPVSENVGASAPVVSGRRPLTATPSSSYESSAPAVDVLAPSSLAQPAAEAPRNFGRRQLPKVKPRFDEDDVSEEKKETASV